MNADVFPVRKTATNIQKTTRLKNLRNNLRSLLFLVRTVIFQHKYDLIFIEVNPYSKIGLVISLLIFFHFLNPKKYVCPFSLKWNTTTDPKIVKFYEKYILHKLALVRVSDIATKRYLARKNRPIKSFFINGIDLSKFKETPIPKNNLFILLFASAPMENSINSLSDKGIVLLLNAFKRLVSIHKNIRLILIWRGKLYKEISALISKMKLEKYVEIINKKVDMKHYFRKAHATIFTLTNLRGSANYPHSLIESLACGRPVIVSNILEISTIVENEKCGEVSDVTVEGVINAVEETIKEYRTLQSNCRKTAEKYFDIRKNIKLLLQELDKSWKK